MMALEQLWQCRAGECHEGVSDFRLYCPRCEQKFDIQDNQRECQSRQSWPKCHVPASRWNRGTLTCGNVEQLQRNGTITEALASRVTL